MGDETAIERWVRVSKQGVMGVLFVMSSDVSEKRAKTWFFTILQMFQVGDVLGTVCERSVTPYHCTMPLHHTIALWLSARLPRHLSYKKR